MTPYTTLIIGVALALLTDAAQAVIPAAGVLAAREPMLGALAPATVPTKGPAPMAHDMANFADVRIPGTWMQQDSMALAVQAALALMGREAEYSRVACLSTNVFSPAVNPGESCASWWHCQAGIGGRALDLMGGALGFRAERLAVPDVDDPGKLNAEGWDAYRAACTPVVRRALANGAVMLTDGGWEQPGYWNFAGLITEVTPEGVMRGTPAFGKPGVVRKYAGTIWALTPAPVTLTPEQADREMARLAVERAASRAPFGDVQWGVFGLAAMDLIVKQMRQGAGFCVECQGRGGNGWGDALDNLKLLHGSADTAATYLRGRADAWPEAARPHIVAAAGHYAKIAELTRPYLTEATLRPLIGDLATQKTLADEVLAPARTALDEAARALTIALVAADLNAPAAGPTRIDGVPHGRGSGDAFCAGLQALLEHAGVEADYDTLMGEVGTAFIMQASAEGPLIGGALDAGWWPLDPAGLQANLDFVSRAHGRRITCVGGMPNQYPTLFRPVVEASIRAGKPVLVDTNWWEVAIGYEADGTLVTFCPSGKYRETHLNSPWCLAFVVGTLPTLDRKQADLEALRHAIALGRDEVSLPWGYTTGQKAYAIWTAALRDMEHCGQARWHANMVGRLRENRRAAVAFLKQVAARNPQASVPLEAAIGHYEELLAAAKTADLSKAALEQSTEGREKLAALAERLAALDAAAVAELERAVHVLEGRAAVIPGMPGGSIPFMDVSWAAAGLDLLLRQRGEATDAQELLALSGDAFNLCHGTLWEGRTPLTTPVDGLKAIAGAYGYTSSWLPAEWSFRLAGKSQEERAAAREAFLDAVFAAIDAGHPVFLGGTHGQCGEWRAVVGYDRARNEWCLAGGDAPYEWTPFEDEKVRELGFWDMQARGPLMPGFLGGWLCNTAFLLGDRGKAPTARERAMAGLRQAVSLHRTPPFVTKNYGGVTYSFGAVAYEAWARDLDALDFPGDLRKPEKTIADHLDLNNMGGEVAQIVRGRTAAATYCERAAEALPEVAAQLRDAAAHYRREAELAKDAFAPFLVGSGVRKGVENDVPWRVRSLSEAARTWLADPAKRAEGVAAIRLLLVEERAAIAAIEEALGRVPITFTGDGVKQDSAALALQAAAKALGRDVDYTTVAPLLGNGFAPAIVPGEGGECPAWWQMSGREHNLDLAARAMGLRIERLALPTRPDEAWADPKVALAHRKACVPALRAALKTGQAILTSGGWASNWNPKASSPYCYWGVITEVRDDGTITGATLNGRDDNPLDRVDPCWVVSLADPTLTQHDADLAVLRQALNRIFGDRGAYAAPGSIWEPRFGLQAMQVWIGQMRRVPFCTECKERSANCAHACTTTLVEGATLSAAYLRRIAPAFPPEVGAHLLEAAKHYARIAELPRPALTGEGGPSFKQIIGDAAAQRAFADGKLYAISDRLALAGQEIDLALIAHGDPPSGRLFLKGDGMKQDSASLAMVAAARTLGVAADYDDVYALSGNAFSPMVNTGEDCAAWWHVESWMAWQGMPNAAARLGLTTTPLPAPEGADNVARRKAVAPAIRQVRAEGGAVVALGGWQVQAGHGFVPWGWAGVVTDARDDGMILGACLNGRTSNPLDTVDRLHQVRKAAAARPEHEAHLTMLRLALVRWYGDAPFAGDAKQRYGARAIDTWIGQMRAVKGFCAGCEEREGKGWTCAVSTAETAIGGATTTAAYLRRIAPSFAEAGRAHLLRAAEHYDRIVALLQPFAAGGYKGLTGDLDRQRAHADTVLVPVRDAYTAAADELAKALAAMPQGPPA